ncbi:MAG TPA: ABC transporter substrate-binding protein [Xanthobacteraceae bacterium]
MTISVRRRDFLTLLGGAAVISPLRARAQQPSSPVIGFLNGTSPDPSLRRVAAFRRGLSELGYEQPRNLAIEVRWAGYQSYELPRLAAELVRRQVAVIAATGSTAAALAAKRASATIPIVFEIGGDPVAAGLLDSLSGSGGNLTGISLNVTALAQAQMQALRELKPKASLLAVFVDTDNPNPGAQARVEAAARAAGLQTLAINVSRESGFDEPFMRLVQQHADALLVGNDPFFLEWRQKIIALAEYHEVPTIYASRAFAAAGGLISCGASIVEGYHQVGVYVGRILNGDKPGDLPVVNSNKFKLAINITTARTLGLSLPQALLSRADEVIE